MSSWTRRTPLAGFLASPGRAQLPNISVDRRLFLLVITELLTAVAVIIAAVLGLSRLADERGYMDRYIFAPLLEIGEAMSAADALNDMLARPPEDLATSAHGPILRLQDFIDRYQRDWETGPSNLPEAVRLRAELERQGEQRLITQEHQAVGDAKEAVGAMARTTGLAGAAPADPPLRLGDVMAVDRALGELNLLNLRYVQIAYRAFERTHRYVTSFFLLVSVAGVLTAALLGFSVRRAIGPRIHRMVEAVERFRERGTIEPIDDSDDDLGLLAHTLGMSFKTIADRDKERERFLAVAAHELKTPLTNLKGYAQIALAHGDDPALRNRALSIIDRQATRLARLAQDLLWSARAVAGQLPFRLAPLDLEALARRVLGEVELVCTGHQFRLASSGAPHLFGDVALLEQAIWNLLVQAATLAPDKDPVRVSVDGTPTWARFSVEAACLPHLPDDLDELVEPFAALPYERGGNGPRSSGLGLHLVREIARLHGASFHLERRPGDVIASVLELRR